MSPQTALSPASALVHLCLKNAICQQLGARNACRSLVRGSWRAPVVQTWPTHFRVVTRGYGLGSWMSDLVTLCGDPVLLWSLAWVPAERRRSQSLQTRQCDPVPARGDPLNQVQLVGEPYQPHFMSLSCSGILQQRRALHLTSDRPSLKPLGLVWERTRPPKWRALLDQQLFGLAGDPLSVLSALLASAPAIGRFDLICGLPHLAGTG